MKGEWLGIYYKYANNAYAFRGSATSVTEQNNQHVLDIYPSPASDRLTIASKGKALESMEIYSVIGLNVYAAKEIGKASATVDVSGLAAGAYCVSVILEDGARIARNFIKK
ncbi:MAG: T9SS type A sorting domain-containing protein [Edaphocola sp.]